jgi:hypothetical protein
LPFAKTLAHGCYCRVGLGMGKGTSALGERAGIHVGAYRSCGENQGGGVGFDAGAVIAAVDSAGANSSGRIAPRRTSVARGGSGAIQIHAAYKTKAATPRISRSVILRATDRGAERRVSKTLGSTAITASERVTPGNSGTLAGAAEAIAGAGACALTGSSLAWREPTIEPTLADKARLWISGRLSIAANPGDVILAKGEPTQKDTAHGRQPPCRCLPLGTR